MLLTNSVNNPKEPITTTSLCGASAKIKVFKVQIKNKMQVPH